MKIKPLSTKEVENIFKSSKLKNSFGYDGVTTKVLKLSSLFISSSLYICNKSVTDWRFLLAGKNSGMLMSIPYTTPLKDASQSSFVYAGKIKLYFLNSGLFFLIIWLFQ
jgi:hypothetical protein